jgi:hypothetical protein
MKKAVDISIASVTGRAPGRMLPASRQHIDRLAASV